MAYIKNIWVDQQVERPKTYELSENEDNTVTLVDRFGEITAMGTPVNAANMNHIENGIEDNDVAITNLISELSTVSTRATNALNNAANAQNTANTALSDAANAQNSANNALTKANTAQNTANNALTTANSKIAAELNNSDTANSGMKLSNGVIINWGEIETTSDSYKTVNFKKNFSSVTSYQILAVIRAQNDTAYAAASYRVSASQAKIYANNSNVSWLAIGK